MSGCEGLSFIFQYFLREISKMRNNERKAASPRTALHKSLLSQSPKEHKELQVTFRTFIIQEIGFKPERDAFFYNAFITIWLLV